MLLAFTVSARADELNWQPAIVGIGLLTAPIALTDSYNTYGHALELEGFSYAATDIFDRFLPSNDWFVGPLLVGMADSAYRIGEMNGGDKEAGKELVCDFFGVIGRVTVKF